MEREIGQPTTNPRRGKSRSASEASSTEKCKRKEVNSWDCSTATANGKASKKKNNDWDSSSECQETMVEPFDGNNDVKDNDWDSESENSPEKSKKVISIDSESFELSIGDLSDFDKSLLNSGTDKAAKELLLEDLEDFPKHYTTLSNKNTEPESSGVSDIDIESEKVRSNRSGTPEDTTVWMIPKSGRTQSADSTSQLISSLEKTGKIAKKSRSLLDVHKSNNKKRSSRTARSSCLDYNKTLLPYEGSNLQAEVETKRGIDRERFERKAFFAEYECRTMTMEKDFFEKPMETSGSNISRTENVITEHVPNGSLSPSLDDNRNSVTSTRVLSRPGPSMDMNVLSMPDIYSRKSIKQRQKDTHRGTLKDGQGAGTNGCNPGTEMRCPTESWFLLENTGQYREISRNEVSILMNGRSADAVLMGRKQLLIPQIKLTECGTLKDSLSCILTKDSLRHFLKEEDIGGEGSSRKLDLERKLENTLLCIQSGMNQTASIRIIPVDTEMIHVWRTARDNMSHLSSEADILIQDQDSEAAMSQGPCMMRRLPADQSLVEQKEPQPQETDKKTSESSNNITTSGDYSRLLLETREIVDNLMNSFKILQNRLDGETHKSLLLQSEVNKLRTLLKNFGTRFGEIASRDLIFDVPTNSSPSIFTIKALDKTDVRSDSVIEEEPEEPENLSLEPRSRVNETKVLRQVAEEKYLPIAVHDSDVITVNIYTFDDSPIGIAVHESNSLIQSNLTLVEERMRRLQNENSSITKQNSELKKKLKEISLELEKYLSETSEHELPHEDEARGADPLRDQVCNLKLELENFKKLAGSEKENALKENFMMREELKKSLLSLKEWCSAAADISQKVETASNKLRETGIILDGVVPEITLDPKTFSNIVNAYVQQTAQNLFIIKNENFLYEQTFKEDIRKRSDPSRETSTLDQVISGYTELIEQCKKGKITGDTENKVMDDYFAIIMEKATLMEEIKILKTENEMLMESQVQHYEKLKQTMIALKEQKSEIVALESSQKLSEEEKGKMADVLKLNKEELEKLREEISRGKKAIEDLMEEIERKDREIDDCSEKLKSAVKEIGSLERSCRLKDELISDLKMESDELSAEEGLKDEEIRVLREEIKNLQMQGAQLESELTSSKVFLTQSQKEMTQYITHLETVINNTQDSLDKNKQKLKESNQTISRLKNDLDVLEKEHQCDVKLHHQTKDELESVKEKLTKTEKKMEDAEQQREEMSKKLEKITKIEREKTEALEILTREYETLIAESTILKEKLSLLSKDKEETLKEQKNLINKYAMMTKELQKLQDKYRSVKAECNERTDLIRYLEMMLRENLIEYNNRIGSLEQNISRLVEKIAACKNGMKEKHLGGDSEVKELRHQLEVTYQERKELENIVNNYYSLMKHLENEVEEREKRVDELHVKLSQEQQKMTKPSLIIQNGRNNLDFSKIQEVQDKLTITLNELEDCRKELQECQSSHENEKKKLELTIADLKSEINRYKLRIEVMMRNLSNSNKTLNGEKRCDANIQTLKKELDEKEIKITELEKTINKYLQDMTTKDADLENFRKKTTCMEEELKSYQNQIGKLRDDISSMSKRSDIQQKEKNEMTEKLLQSIKLIMEEKSARQTIETLAAEKEKNLKNQIEQLQNELTRKAKECECVLDKLEDKKGIVGKLQDDLKRIRQELNEYKKKTNNKGGGDGYDNDYVRSPNVSSERLETCMRDLKEVRDLNLHLRKAEGQYQAKIVRLEDEIRDARLLIKELQGDIKTEKKSKKALKNMIVAAKMEVEKCLLAKQLMSVVADRISRHLDLAEVSSRELLSGFRLSDPKILENSA